MGGTQAGHSPPPSLASQENRQGVGRGWEIGGGGGSGNPDGFCPSTTASFFRLLLFPIVSAKIHKEEFYDCFSCYLLPLRCRLGIRELNYRERGAARASVRRDLYGSVSPSASSSLACSKVVGSISAAVVGVPVIQAFSPSCKGHEFK